MFDASQLSDAQRADIDAENRGTDPVNLHMRRLELIDLEQRRADPLFDRVRFARLVHSHRAKVRTSRSQRRRRKVES